MYFSAPDSDSGLNTMDVVTAMDVPTTLIMHASLALTHPSLTTYSHLISQPLSLPYEILHQIRSDLLATITASLLAETADAKRRYEDSVQASLCADCREYNVYIFGEDVWGWPGYKGGCACLEREKAVEEARNEWTWFGFLGRCFGKKVPRPTTTASPQVLVRSFASPTSWLKHHLSSHPLLAQPHLRSGDICELVSTVLASYECRLVPSRGLPSDRVRIGMRRSRCGDKWYERCMLRKAVKELGLLDDGNAEVHAESSCLATVEDLDGAVPFRDAVYLSFADFVKLGLDSGLSTVGPKHNDDDSIKTEAQAKSQTASGVITPTRTILPPYLLLFLLIASIRIFCAVMALRAGSPAFTMMRRITSSSY